MVKSGVSLDAPRWAGAYVSMYIYVRWTRSSKGEEVDVCRDRPNSRRCYSRSSLMTRNLMHNTMLACLSAFYNLNTLFTLFPSPPPSIP